MSDSAPVHLYEDDDDGRRFLIYSSDTGVRLEIRYEGEALWMTQAQVAELFGVTVPSISRHIANIYEEGELERTGTFTEIETVRVEGGRRVVRTIEHYTLDMVISVGYRVSSKQATMFRRWATEKLVQFATKGFVVDAQRLKSPDNADRVAELREIIRDIRSDEANVYRELRSICAMCQDYEGESEACHEFYRNTQAKIVYAVTSKTPAEILRERADASVENMGLQTWANENIRKTDVTTSKNFLAPQEMKELNRLTTILLDIFEDQLDLGKLVLMADAERLLDTQLKQLSRVVLRHGGSVKMVTAKRHAENEYEKYKAKLKAMRHSAADKAIADIKATQKALPKGRKRSPS
jgi:hypothetical protein